MTDTDVAQAQAALSGPVSTDPEVLGAVRRGLLSVPAEPQSAEITPVTAGGHPQLAARRRAAG